MKKFMLKQWYPSLQRKTIKGNIANWCSDEMAHEVRQNSDRVELLDKSEVENNPDFWELIEEEKPKPLFITEDGVEVFDRDGIVWLVRNNNFDKIKIHSIHLNEHDFGHKVFFLESSADKYILWNKPLFSLQDIDATIKGHLPEFDELIKIAKERIKG